ncbi:MAG TPA: hypothetical protein VH333_12010 [Pseudonocardiaceae bacterium]|jgi:hypothetical protein|nr:hypothetical protein [Pseudonocardiaceae bacterium]
MVGSIVHLIVASFDGKVEWLIGTSQGIVSDGSPGCKNQQLSGRITGRPGEATVPGRRRSSRPDAEGKQVDAARERSPADALDGASAGLVYFVLRRSTVGSSII